MTAQEVANTILKQITFGQANTIRYRTWGSHSLKFGEDKGENLGFLHFKVQGFKFKGYVKVSLAFNDTYTIEFIKTKRKKNKELSELFGRTKYDVTKEVLKTYEGIYFDQLNELIDEYVEKQSNYSF